MECKEKKKKKNGKESIELQLTDIDEQAGAYFPLSDIAVTRARQFT